MKGVPPHKLVNLRQRRIALLPQLLGASGTIVADVSCHRCAYNLRGLQQAGRCPECGSPIELSISGDLLSFAEPDWVARLSAGAWFTFGGVALVTALGAFVAARAPAVVSVSVVLLGNLLSLIGGWLLTAPDPSREEENHRVSARKVVRVGLAVGMITASLGFLGRGWFYSRSFALVIVWAILLGGIGDVVGEIARLAYLKKIALRIPKQEYARHAAFLQWAYGITFALTTLLRRTILIGAMAGIRPKATVPGRRPSALAGGIACLTMMDVVALLIFGSMYLVLLYRLGRAFRSQAQASRQNWTGSDASMEAASVRSKPDDAS
jgi:hypothetical protein